MSTRCVKPFDFGRCVRRPRLHRKAYARYRFCQAGVLLHAWPCFRHTYFNSMSARTEPAGHSPTTPFAPSDGPCARVRTVSTPRRPTTSARRLSRGRFDAKGGQRLLRRLLLGRLLRGARTDAELLSIDHSSTAETAVVGR